MKAFWSRLGEVWCSSMHPAPMWPSHGKYQCPECLRIYPVPWDQRGRAQGGKLAVFREALSSRH